MTPATYNFTIYKGATWSREITMKVDGVVVDLRGYSARMTIRRTYDSAPLLTLSSEGSPPAGIILSAGSPTPNILITITAEQTAALKFVNAVYDLELVYPDGVTVARLLQGVVTLNSEATK